MSYVRRAILSVTRRKGKSLILFAIVFILGNLIAGAVSIQRATDQVEKATKSKLGSVASIQVDYDKLMKESDGNMNFNVKPIKLDAIHKMGKRPEVKYYDYNTEAFVNEGSAKPYKVENDGFEAASYFKLKGVQYAPVLDFEEKKNKLVDGRVFNESDVKEGKRVAIISKKVAEENNLSVGDTFTIKNDVYEKIEQQVSKEVKPAESRDLALEVIGIFEQVEYEKADASKKGNGMDAFVKMDVLNTIYVPNKVAESETLYQNEANKRVDSSYKDVATPYAPTFVLKNPEDVEKFEKAVAPMVPKNYKLQSSTAQYDKIAGPIKSIGSIAQIVLMASILASLIIIGLIVILFLRDRKHEFGIYLSLGEKKRKVLSQVVLELVLIAFVGITISLFTGNILAKNVSQTMMSNQLSQKEDNSNAPFTMPDANEPNVSTEEVVESYSVQMDMNYILIFYGLGLGTVILSSLAPMIYITRLNPKKILL